MDEAALRKAVEDIVSDSIGSKKPGKAAMGRLIATGVPMLLLEWVKGERQRGTPIPDVVVALLQLAPAPAIVALGVMPPPTVPATAALAKAMFAEIIDKTVAAATARFGKPTAEMRRGLADTLREMGAPEEVIKAASGE